MNIEAVAKPLPRFVHDGMISCLWKLGHDTCEIAHRLNVPESHIANRLWRLRSAVPE